MFEIKPLNGISLDELYASHNEAFKDYDFSWNKHELAKMLKRRGYKAELSFGTFENDKLVSFTLNGIGTFNGKHTAYDAGTGTIKEYRGKGLATRIFNESVLYLKQEGIRQYLLEVLKHNTQAASVYEKIGFKVSRELNYFRTEINKLNAALHKLPPGVEMRNIDLSLKEEMMAMCDFPLSWQNSFEALSRNTSDFVMLGAFRTGTLVGYGVVEPESGDISQLAVKKEERRQGIGSAILKELLGFITHERVKIVNIDKAQEGIKRFIEANGIPHLGSQYEMILSLDE